MLLTCGFVWGGFVLLLSYAIRSERKKTGLETKNLVARER
jgi:hypothetical protein